MKGFLLAVLAVFLMIMSTTLMFFGVLFLVDTGFPTTVSSVVNAIVYIAVVSLCITGAIYILSNHTF